MPRQVAVPRSSAGFAFSYAVPRGSEVIIDGTPIHFGRKSEMINSGLLA